MDVWNELVLALHKTTAQGAAPLCGSIKTSSLGVRDESANIV